jgi:hypothetical protein
MFCGIPVSSCVCILDAIDFIQKRYEYWITESRTARARTEQKIPLQNTSHLMMVIPEETYNAFTNIKWFNFKSHRRCMLDDKDNDK